MMQLPNGSGWPWKRMKKEEEDWRMMQLPNGSEVGHGDGQGKKRKTGE